MADPSTGPESARSRPPPDLAPRPVRGTVFLADASAEAERVAQALRSEGYQVVDVPLSLLVARVAVQRPTLVLLDADAEGAMDVLGRVREMPGAAGIDVFFFGEPGRTLRDRDDAIARGASAFFPRPLDVASIAKQITVLASEAPAADPSVPPVSLPPSKLRPPSAPASVRGPVPEPLPSVPVPEPIAPQILEAAALDQGPLSSSSPPGVAPPSLAPASILESPIDPSTWTGQAGAPSVGTQLSDELQRVLASAEERVGSAMALSSEPPSPDAEVDAVLPADLLESLDEPVGFDDDEEAEGSASWASATPSRAGTTSARTTGIGGPQAQPAAPTAPREEEAEPRAFMGGTQSFAPPDLSSAHETPTPLPPRRGSEDEDADRETPRPPRRPSITPAPSLTADRGPPSLEGPETRIGSTDDGGPRSAPVQTFERFATPAPSVPRSEPPTPARATSRRETSPPPTAAHGGREAAREEPSFSPNAVLTEGESLRILGRAAAERLSGSLCFDAGNGLRRVVLRDGDLVTAGSSFDDETLLAFLVARGDLPKDVARKLSGRLAPFGRHAGAALIAHGHLGQDRLWEVLRSHAEWIVGKIVALDSGTVTLEPDPPGRLRAEPSVFGGSAGAEVLVEVARRIVPPPIAIQRLGGPRARLADGPRRQLLSECALDAREAELVDRVRGSTVAEAVDAAQSPEIASVLLALASLGVVETLAPAARPSSAPPPAHDPLDEEALRARVRARLDLVEEGDYFAILGVPRAATPYEIRRAYVELRRSFEPGRVLTAATADLVAPITTILEVLDEAYEVLRDANRRERYRRAIEAEPRA